MLNESGNVETEKRNPANCHDRGICVINHFFCHKLENSWHTFQVELHFWQLSLFSLICIWLQIGRSGKYTAVPTKVDASDHLRHCIDCVWQKWLRHWDQRTLNVKYGHVLWQYLFYRTHVHMGSDHWVAMSVRTSKSFLKPCEDLVKTVNVVNVVKT